MNEKIQQALDLTKQILDEAVRGGQEGSVFCIWRGG